MASTFGTLNIGYSGLSAAQIAVDTTSHNISNANNEGYTRQRVVLSATTPVYTSAGNRGNGVMIDDIARVFDNFIYKRYTDVSSEKEYSDFTQNTLKELSTYFPEIDNIGIKSDLQEYYNMWQTLADNPDNNSIKLSLSKQAQVLANNIKSLQDKVVGLQKSINDQLLSNVNEVNLVAQQIADVNKAIGVAEAGGGYTANDLRDKRDSLALSLSKLIGANANYATVVSNIKNDGNSNEGKGNYNINIGGFNIVDGSSFHPIHIQGDKNPNGFYELSYERQDGALIPMEESIKDGRIGAILALRGDGYSASNGGVLQSVVEQIDAFATSIINSTNNLYASSATTSMESNDFNVASNVPILSSTIKGVKKGSFDIVIYDINGQESARRTIEINDITTLSGAAGTNSIEGQIKAIKDDNNDGNANNDVDDFLQYYYGNRANGDAFIGLGLDALSLSQGYTFAIEDNLKDGTFNSGTNFAGALGLSKFFDGKDASSMDLNLKFKDNPTAISAGLTSSSGDNRLALNMVQQQFESYDYKLSNATYNSSIYAMFDTISTGVGATTKEAILSNQAISAKFNATELEFSSVSKVSIDEELTNLIKYQTSYGAASKIITTIDQMLQTLLGLKQ